MRILLKNCLTYSITGLTNAFATGAKTHGAKIVEDCPVESIVTKSDGRGRDAITGVRTKFGDINCKTCVLAAGAWSKDLAHKLGVELPMRVIRHNYLVSEVIDDPGLPNLPNTRMFDDSFYMKVSDAKHGAYAIYCIHSNSEM